MKQWTIVLIFCLFPLLVAARPTTGGGALQRASASADVYRPTTQTVEFHPSSAGISVQRPASANTPVSHPTTQDTSSRPATNVSVFRPTTSVGVFQSPTVDTFPAPKSMEAYVAEGRGNSSAGGTTGKNKAASSAKKSQKAVSFSSAVKSFAQTRENAPENQAFKEAKVTKEKYSAGASAEDFKQKAFKDVNINFGDAIKNRAKGKGQE